MGRPTFDLGPTFGSSVYKGQGRRKRVLFACLYSRWQARSFIGITAFKTLAHTEDQLRIQPRGLNKYWILGLPAGRQVDIIGLGGQQILSHSNKSPF